MLRDMTIGQYYPADSLLHRLDPRVKLVGTVIFLISVFLINSIPTYAIVTAVLLICIFLSKVPVKFMLKGLRAIAVIMLMTFLFNIFLTPGEELVRFGILKITKEGVITGVYMFIRLFYLVIGASLMTLTTTPNQLTDGLEKGLKILNRFHIPIHEIALMMAIALRFIPTLTQEMDKIMKAQKARGADFESGGLKKRAQGLIPLLVPLFVAAIRRANDLALAMDARCYHGGSGRTKMKPLQYKGNDLAAYICIVIYFTGMILLRVFIKKMQI